MHVNFVCVAALARESELNGDLAVQCALLHDVIKDTEVGNEEVEAGFGTAVANNIPI